MAAVTGNTLILKPSERDPGAAIMIAELCERAGKKPIPFGPIAHSTHTTGLPSGVLNIVHGTSQTVNAICDHPTIKAISFVGGDRAGKHIHSRGTHNGKRVQVRGFMQAKRSIIMTSITQANLGAKNHAVILPDS